MPNLRLLLALSAITPICFAALPACGSDDDDGGGGGAKYTLDNVCDQVVPQICQSRQPCCDQGPGYGEEACMEKEMEDCNADVEEAKAGTLTFDPSGIDECLSKLTTLANSCEGGLAAIQGFRDLKVCSTIFVGTLQEGESCERDSQCAPGSDDVFTGCDEDTNQCSSFEFVGEGDPCSIGDDLDTLCDDGLYCDAVISGMPPFQGTCKAATPIGGSCDAMKMFNLECGLALGYCDGGTCAAAKAGGASCTDDLECESVTCNAGTCDPVDPLFDADDCGST